ncbi:MAG TPA: glutathionylspermidine synthase family protein [Nitrospirales bacterium]|nr:glutathionylspermidine synthase family protein [Nitrospirales bacterium]
MIREASAPRENWTGLLDEVGFTFHTAEGPYWRETACYALTAAEVAELERATTELQALCLAVVEHVIVENRFDALRIPDHYRAAIRRSWERQAPSLYGRFDLRYDGEGPPVLLEYNADTPTSLLEASVAQWHWVEATHPHDDQFNRIHEALIARWRHIGREHRAERFHFTGLLGSDEDRQTVLYLEDTAKQAGLCADRVSLEAIGWDVQARRFCDEQCRPISWVFKLYPWEWMLSDAFTPLLLESSVGIVEPAWKMILSNKGVLPLLWELFPSHPNLLPAYVDPSRLGREYVRKPFWSREGANIVFVGPCGTIATSGPYGDCESIYQACHPLPDYGGWHPVIGSWVIGDEAAGIGIRESSGFITDDESCFVPHYFR